MFIYAKYVITVLYKFQRKKNDLHKKGFYDFGKKRIFERKMNLWFKWGVRRKWFSEENELKRKKMFYGKIYEQNIDVEPID